MRIGCSLPRERAVHTCEWALTDIDDTATVAILATRGFRMLATGPLLTQNR